MRSNPARLPGWASSTSASRKQEQVFKIFYADRMAELGDDPRILVGDADQLLGDVRQARIGKALADALREQRDGAGDRSRAELAVAQT